MRTIKGASSTDARRDAVEDLIADIGRSFRELRCVGSQRLVKLGISMTHLHVLTMLRHHGALPMSRVAELLDVSLSNATGIVDRLEDRGYVERVRVKDDRRVVLVQPTVEADRIIDEVDVLRADLMSGVLARLDGERLAKVESGLRAFRDAFAEEISSRPEMVAHSHHERGRARDVDRTPATGPAPRTAPAPATS